MSTSLSEFAAAGGGPRRLRAELRRRTRDVRSTAFVAHPINALAGNLPSELFGAALTDLLSDRVRAALPVPIPNPGEPGHRRSPSRVTPTARPRREPSISTERVLPDSRGRATSGPRTRPGRSAGDFSPVTGQPDPTPRLATDPPRLTSIDVAPDAATQPHDGQPWPATEPAGTGAAMLEELLAERRSQRVRLAGSPTTARTSPNWPVPAASDIAAEQWPPGAESPGATPSPWTDPATSGTLPRGWHLGPERETNAPPLREDQPAQDKALMSSIAAGPSTTGAPSDDDFAARLAGLLRRQALRHGIDLS